MFMAESGSTVVELDRLIWSSFVSDVGLELIAIYFYIEDTINFYCIFKEDIISL